MSRRPVLVVVTGPTASGKTALAVELACRYGTEIVSADSRQIFKHIPIGTAAPTLQERSRAFHHLVGVKELDEYYSASEFERDALAILEGIWQKSPVAVVCGGSMMYIDSLCYGLDDMPTVSPQTRAYVLAMLENNGIEGVLAQLKICDPAYWEIVDRSNTRRVVHALEICIEAGKPYSTFRTGQRRQRPFEIVKFAIDRPRAELFDRINRRVDQMVAQGLVQEAREAFAKGNFNSLNTVGFKEMKAWFDGEMDFDTAVARIGKNTRVYAKKQLTWMNRQTEIVYLQPPLENALAQASEIIDKILKNK